MNKIPIMLFKIYFIESKESLHSDCTSSSDNQRSILICEKKKERIYGSTQYDMSNYAFPNKKSLHVSK